MKKIRIGNDFRVTLKVTRNGVPENLEDKTLRLELSTVYARQAVENFTVSGNEITFDFLSGMQKHSGSYRVTCTLLRDGGQNTFDVCDAFQLVSCSCQAGGDDNNHIHTETVALSADLRIGDPNGSSGGEGISDYDSLSNRPKINGITLSGNRSSGDLDLQPRGNYALKSELPDVSGLATKDQLSKKVDAIPGKQLSTEDFTATLKLKLEKLTNYDDTTLREDIIALKGRLDTLIGGSAGSAIDTFREIEAFLQGITDTETLSGLMSDLRTDIISLIPSRTSQLVNDTNLVADELYVHTDNNFTTGEKTKLEGLANYDDSEIRQEIGTKVDAAYVETKVGPVDMTDEPGAFFIDPEGKVAMKYDADGFDVAELSPHFKSLLPSGSGMSDHEFDHIIFDDLYMVDNKYPENQFIPVLQSERFTNDTASGKYYPLLDGGHTALPAIGRLSSTDAMMTNGTTKDIDMSVSVGCENNLRTYPVPYTLRKVYSEAVSKQVRLLTVGDSFAANSGGSSEYPEYSFFSFAQKLGMTDEALRGKENQYITLGTTGYRYNGWGKWTVNGKEMTLVSHSEGRGGWTASVYARHVINTTNYKGMWYLLGLDAQYGEYDSYSGNVDRTKLVHSVPSKVIDPSYIKNEDAFKVAWNGSTPSVSWNGGSSAAKQAAADYYNGLVNNTITTGRNPFFNVNKAGDIKFDLQFYLDNYKTHSDDGVTELSVGSTAGNSVTEITQYMKVCTPTHIVLLLGTNDVSAFNDPEKLYADLKAIAEACISAVPSVKVAVIFPPSPGTLYPERHQNVTNEPVWEPHTQYKWIHFKALQRAFADDAGINKSKIYFLNTFICTDTYTTSPGSVWGMSPGTGQRMSILKKDPLHLGIAGYRDIGYQIYAWTYYSSLK